MKIPLKIQQIAMIALGFIIANIPLVFAYNLSLPIFDLWTVFVVMVFGGFWLSVLGIGGIIALILMIGGVSKFTIIGFEMMFVLSMTIGWGYNLITIPLFALITLWSITQFAKLINSSNY